MSMWDLEEGGGGLNGATGIVTNAYFADGEYGWSLVIQTKFDDPVNYPKFEDQMQCLIKDWAPIINLYLIVDHSDRDLHINQI